MAINSLIYIISPIQVISSLSAVRTLHGSDDVNVTIVTHWPGASSEFLEELKLVVEDLCKAFLSVRNVITISSETISKMLSSSSIKRASSMLKEYLGKTEYAEIYFSHDVVGHLYQLLSHTYPDAQRICYGDAFGNVYERSVHLSYLQNEPDIMHASNSLSCRITRKAKEFLRGLRSSLSSEKELSAEAKEQVPLDDFKPHRAALILPIDQSGNFLKKIPLSVCPKQIVNEVLQQSLLSCTDLNQYVSDTINNYRDQNRYLLLTDNFAEGNFIGFDREIEMYCAVISYYCSPGSVIFLKSHPGETLPRNEKIKECLGTTFKVIELDTKFRRYPVEIWQELVRNSTIICMSYPVLSLKYLYNTDVIQPMDHSFIEKWFPEWTWRSYKNSLSLYMEPLKNLSTWDGSSVLWAGP